MSCAFLVGVAVLSRFAAMLEPIQTRTLARILNDQGLHVRARRILERLVESNPNDHDLQRELDATPSEDAFNNPGRRIFG